MTGPGQPPARPGEIAGLLAWARSLTRAGQHARPAYLAAKADLLERIAAWQASQPDAARAGDARQIAAAARAAARQAAAAAALREEQ